MVCPICGSLRVQSQFAAEMMVYFPGLKNIGNPGVFLASTLSVCLNCGFGRFTVSDSTLDSLRIGEEPDATDRVVNGRGASVRA
jgi:hypothetical protein